MVITSRRIVTVVVWAIALVLPGAATAQEDTLSVLANTHNVLKDLRIEWQEFKELYDAGRIVVVDVRSADAFEAGHIPGARSVPVDVIGIQAEALQKLHKPIILYSAGPADRGSARAAVVTLWRQGVTARELVGGLSKWSQETNGKIERGK